MKKIWSVMFMIVVAFFTLNVCEIAYGAENDEMIEAATVDENITTTTTVEYMEDGSYVETVITSKKLASEISTYSTTSSSAFMAQGTKTMTSYSSSGEKLWAVTVIGTFRVVTGVSSTCTNATGYAEAYHSNWKVGEVTTAYSGNTARATATGTHYLAFIKVSSETITAALACDVYGNMN
jgi:hypothetical protein